jgi:leucyl/phenylalanyl-tRNA--protein transferase
VAIYLLPEAPLFPPAGDAEEDGLLAIGGDLSAGRLIQAYSNGIFPWFEEDKTIYWYSPDPRMVLFPENFHPPDSLKRLIRSKKFEVSIDRDFKGVIKACAESERPGQEGTWISDTFITAYTTLHDSGLAHSVEVYAGGKLAGGLYGVSLGVAFFGESMFFRMRDASKVALYFLVDHCKYHGLRFIDCQVETSHLLNLGASLLPREQYLSILRQALRRPTIKRKWG